MNTAYLLIGGNIGDRWHYLQLCRDLLDAKAGTIVQMSHVYETEAWGNANQSNFLNQVLQLNTAFNAENLLSICQSIEQSLDRKRQEQWGARTIDIDILFFNNDVVASEHLHIPHPQIANRRFTLVPLHEIAADYFHPVLHKFVWQLLDACTDHLEAKPYHEPF
jgi:2-amino-4-hydroxy-6-hydroxymethyldihydropteridine diphosphokinase